MSEKKKREAQGTQSQAAAEKKEKEAQAQQTTAEETAAKDAAQQPAPEEKAPEETVSITRERLEQLEGLEAELARQKEQYLRLAAEYDNYRKRTAKEKEALYTDGKIDTIEKFLGVYDNLERGLAQFQEDSAHRQGMEMICKQFLDTLHKLGVTEMEAQDQPFDPEKHNAVMHVDDEALGENTVSEVFQKGFMLGDRVLRFAAVKVAN